MPSREEPLISYRIGTEEIKTRNFYRDVFSEYLATFLLLFIGVGATIEYGEHHTFPCQVGLSMGIAIEAVYIVFNQASGALVNPAVSFAFLFAGFISLLRCVFYVFAQLLGGITAVGLYKLLLPDLVNYFAFTQTNEKVSMSNAFLMEFFINMLFILAWLRMYDAKNKCMQLYGSSVVGFLYLACVGVSSSYTKGHMNPAKFFGVALFMNDFTLHLVYWLGPLVSALCCAVLYNAFLSPYKHGLMSLLMNKKRTIPIPPEESP